MFGLEEELLDEIDRLKIINKRSMKTEDKLDLIISLLKEVEQEFNDKAEEIKELDRPLYRNLKEDCAYNLQMFHKGIITSEQFVRFKSRLEAANKLLINNL